eukprot:233399_1
MAAQILDTDGYDEKTVVNDELTQFTQILRANDLYDHLFDVLRVNHITHTDLIEIRDDEINDVCKELKLSGVQKLKFKRLIRIIHKNKSAQSDNKVDTEEHADDDELKIFLNNNKLPLYLYGIFLQQEIGYKELSSMTPYNIDKLCEDNNIKIGIGIKLKKAVEKHQFQLLKNNEQTNVTSGLYDEKKQTFIEDPDLKKLAKNEGMSSDLYNSLIKERITLKLLGRLTTKGIDTICEKNHLGHGEYMKLKKIVCELQREQTYDHEINITVIGDSNVGKTCLVNRYVRNEYSVCGSTHGIDQMYVIQGTKDGAIAKICLVDTAGQERFRSIMRNLWRRTDAILMCYSIDNEESFQDICGDWLERVTEYAKNDVIVMLVATKLDINSRPKALEPTEVEITIKQQDEWKSYQPVFMECSALTGYNVENVFQTATELVLRQKRTQPKSAPQAIRLHEMDNDNDDNMNGNNNSWKCCK